MGTEEMSSWRQVHVVSKLDKMSDVSYFMLRRCFLLCFKVFELIKDEAVNKPEILRNANLRHHFCITYLYTVNTQ